MKSTESLPFHTASANSAAENDAAPISHGPIVEATLKQHNFLTQPRYPHRRTEHEDCCGYCERYCENKLSSQRHHEIIAWREEVNNVRETAAMTSRNSSCSYKLKFLKHVPDDGKGNDNSVVYSPRKLHSARTNQTNTPRSDDDLASDFASMTLVPVGEASRSTLRGDTPAGKQSKVIAGYDDGRYTPAPKEEEQPQTDVSDRTMSNQLLNVLTIDDAMRHHRYQLISNQPKIIPGGAPREQQLSIKNGDNHSDELEIEKTCSAQFLDYPSRGKKSTDDRSNDLKQEKYQKIIPVDSNGVPVRSVRQVLYPESTGYPSEGSSAAEGPNDYVMRAVEQAWERSKPPQSKARNGRYKYIKPGQEPVAKPESKRFQKLNRNLHKLMETDYLPNNKLSKKLKLIRSQSAAADTGNSKVQSKGRVMTTMSLPGSRQNTRIRMYDGRKGHMSSTPVDYNGKENFLEMIMDMDEKL